MRSLGEELLSSFSQVAFEWKLDSPVHMADLERESESFKSEILNPEMKLIIREVSSCQIGRTLSSHSSPKLVNCREFDSTDNFAIYMRLIGTARGDSSFYYDTIMQIL